VDDSEELVGETIDEFGITFVRPELWQFRREETTTYLYWDEDGGSLRITPVRAAVTLDRYLAGVLETERAHDPKWRVFDAHKGIAWVADGESRTHFYVTGRDDLVIVCSYAYDPDLFEEDDEFYAPAIEAGLEHVDALLASMKF
jgi:hypothetical protein